MVKVNHQPTQTLIVHDVVRMELDNILRERVTPSGALPLYWGNGFVFGFTPLPVSSKRVLEDYLDGKVHWMEVHYTHKKDYEEILKLDDEQYAGAVKVRVIDVSKRALFKDFLEWLKSYDEKQ